MKRIFMTIVMALAAVLSFAQARFSASYILDLNAKTTTPVVSYLLSTYHDVLGKPNFNLDLASIAAVNGQMKLGLSLTHTWHYNFDKASVEFKPKIDLTLGLWTNYGLDTKQLRVGPAFGVGFSF